MLGYDLASGLRVLLLTGKMRFFNEVRNANNERGCCSYLCFPLDKHALFQKDFVISRQARLDPAGAWHHHIVRDRMGSPEISTDEVVAL